MSKIVISLATSDDIAGIVAVETERYSDKYDKNGKLVDEFVVALKKRMKIAHGWMWVAKIEGVVVGCLSAQPTAESYISFVSWEQSTDNGTLVNTFNANGDNVYVVNLDVARSATKAGAQYALMTFLAAKCIAENKKTVYFESRMPGFRDWVYTEKGITKNEWHSLPNHDQLRLAQSYSTLEVTHKGQRVFKDRLINFYKKNGFTLHAVIMDAYEDDESLNVGATFYYDNDLPRVLKVPVMRRVISFLVRRAGSFRLLERLI